MSTITDLTREAPRSPRQRLGGYDILARAVDKGRATLAGKPGEYHFDCPVDNMLFSFKGVKGDDFKRILASGTADDGVLAWLNAQGAKKTPEEIKAWSESVEGLHPYGNPAQKEWFSGECARLKLDPAATSLFDYLEEDDRQTFAGK